MSDRRLKDLIRFYSITADAETMFGEVDLGSLPVHRRTLTEHESIV